MCLNKLLSSLLIINSARQHTTTFFSSLKNSMFWQEHFRQKNNYRMIPYKENNSSWITSGVGLNEKNQCLYKSNRLIVHIYASFTISSLLML
jgi:hypothetical protein